MVQFGQATSAWEIAVFNMMASFKQPMDLVKLHAVDHFKSKHKLASGAIGTVVVERCWWLVEEGIIANRRITGSQ